MADRLVTKAAQVGYAALQALAYVAEDRLPARLEDWGDLHEVEWEVWERAVQVVLDGADAHELHGFLLSRGAPLAGGAASVNQAQFAAYELFRNVVGAFDAAVAAGAVEGSG